ncbi:flagellar hook protein FlgK [Arsukibacterium ikkense]|uniref:Flagellar hook-associated protein 1 n=1 Tax=Arsukibacterium ikkense TaxID=336831 RepID=A0A0M2V328_9GAMM|nr:flagellar hook-associated protein FlgK [Arsukibacterium ikkense]KKO44050.1 flagellar hook protein FlgK [Arsukibacterium ikkense]
MSDNLLRIGTSAVLASNTLLSTTSNNIANINTPGYVRQRTEFQAQILGLGVGKGTTERLVSEFTLKQLRRDTSNASYAAQYLSEANRVDSLFSNPANSIATGINNLFQQLQTANNEPTNVANRQLIIGSAQSLLDKFDTLSNLVLDQENFINQQLDIYVNEANDYIGQIARLNKEIASYGTGASKPLPLDLFDKRDSAILKLSEMMEIRTLDALNGEKLVFMNTGQALVVEQGDFALLALRGNPDPSRKELQLQLSTNSNVLRDINSKELGGKLGAIVGFREEILDPTQLQLGQLALSITDAFNTQNKLGMDLNQQIGKNIFILPEFNALNFRGNTGTGFIVGSVEPSKGNQLPPNDFLATVTATGIRLEALDAKGNVIAGSAIDVVTDFSTPINSANTTSDPTDLYGLQLNITGAPAVGDQFLLKPFSTSARGITLATTRPEDIALAAPVRGEYSVNNLGNGVVSNLLVSNTDPATSQFLSPTGLAGNPPYSVTYTNSNEFTVTDSTNTVLGVASFPSGTYQNVLAQAGLANYGFDFDIAGVPSFGDSYTIEFNEGGFNDNRNGLILSELQTGQTTRRNAVVVPNAINEYSFNQSYATMVGTIGERTRQGRINDEASTALLQQTTLWYESLSGVSLDEEASNLIRFQQTYAAAARIISTSQTVFDTLLAAVR